MNLIDLVLEQLQKDIANEDLTAIEELLTHVPYNILENFLSENSAYNRIVREARKETK
jgi:hypothetical protein